MEFERRIKSTNSQHEGLCRCSHCIRLHCCKFYIFLYQFAYELIILIVIAFFCLQAISARTISEDQFNYNEGEESPDALGVLSLARGLCYKVFSYATMVQLLMLIEFKFYYFHRRKLYTSTAATMTSRNGSSIHAFSSLIWFRDIDNATVRVCAFKR